MAEKVTIMVLKVDLECTKCYKKVKKLLCKYPQIRDQVYNEKANTVTITVVCCSPEKIRDKLRCKGRGTIKSIDIKEPEKKKKEQEKKITEPDNKPPPCNCGCGSGRSICYDNGYGRRPCNCGCGSGWSICYDNGYGRGCTVITRCDYYNHCHYYFSEENQVGCTVM